MPTATGTEHRVSFPTEHEPVSLPEDAGLSEHLTVTNSPVLFGCRTGICGTCLSAVKPLGEAALEPPEPEEEELLALIAPRNPQARLICQLKLRCDVQIEPIPH